VNGIADVEIALYFRSQTIEGKSGSEYLKEQKGKSRPGEKVFE